jgi:hypothetical protein
MPMVLTIFCGGTQFAVMPAEATNKKKVKTELNSSHIFGLR